MLFLSSELSSIIIYPSYENVRIITIDISNRQNREVYFIFAKHLKMWMLSYSYIQNTDCFDAEIKSSQNCSFFAR